MATMNIVTPDDLETFKAKPPGVNHNHFGRAPNHTRTQMVKVPRSPATVNRFTQHTPITT